MKIIDKLQEVHNFITNNNPGQGVVIAENLQRLAIKAIHNGSKSRDWEKLIEAINEVPNLENNPSRLEPTQISRLLGEETAFNNTDWGLISLAYVAANSTCGIATTTDTKKNMPIDAQNILDA